MEKVALQTADIAVENAAKLAELFPDIVTEVLDEDGNVRHSIDVEALKAHVGDVAEDKRERYQFTWPGKQRARAEAIRPISKTMRPCPEESVNWDTTENLYIEGDNLDALKILRETYAGKIKMIYIDPPYNTGKDRIYIDSSRQGRSDELSLSAAFDAAGNLLDAAYKVNSEASGTFHSDWCSMMYPRLLLAKDLLKDDGVIFISMDDSESKTVRGICDEIFGPRNFIAQMIWQNKKGGGNDSIHIAVEHEYIFAYAKSREHLQAFFSKYSEDYLKRYKDRDEIGKFYWDTFRRKSGKQYYPIECPDGTVLEYDDDGNKISWLRSEERFRHDLEKGEVRIVPSKNGEWSVQFKQRMPKGKKPRSIFTTNTVIDSRGTNSTGSDDVYSLFKKDVFSNPKPVELIKYLLGFAVSDGDIVLDFFSGSGTTAQALMGLNCDGANRSFIMVQIGDADVFLDRPRRPGRAASCGPRSCRTPCALPLGTP